MPPPPNPPPLVSINLARHYPGNLMQPLSKPNKTHICRPIDPPRIAIKAAAADNQDVFRLDRLGKKWLQ